MKKTFYFFKTLCAGAVLLLFTGTAFGQTTNVPTIDGDGSDAAWDQAVAWPIEAVIDNSGVTDAADLSGTVQVLWSADNFYVKVEVTDDVLYGGSGAAYIYDNVCIYLDVTNLATAQYVVPTQMYWEKNWWQAATQMGGRTGPNWAAPPGTFGVSVVEGTGYTIELTVPWSTWGYTPAEGNVLGFDIKLSDNDNLDNEHRDQICWRDVTDTGWTNPLVFGEITMNADGTFSGQTQFEQVTDGFLGRAWAFVPGWDLTAVVNNDGGAITNPLDLSGRVWVMWTADSLFVDVTVLDDSLYGGTGAAYLYDNICIYLDVFNDATTSYQHASQMYWEKNWWQANNQMGGRVGPDWMAPPGNFGVTVMPGTGYNIELAVAWSEWEFTPEVGATLGFDVKLSDNDHDMDDHRDQICWRDVTDTGWTNPLVFGEITMLDGGLFSGQTKFTPEIDGVIAGDRAWAFTPQFGVQSVISDDSHSGASDYTGTTKVTWDNTAIYAYVDVVDDVLWGSGDPWYTNDVISVFYDLLKKQENYTDTTMFYYEKAMYAEDHSAMEGGRFGPDWTPAPGNWELSLRYDGETLLGYTFEVATAWADVLDAPLGIGDVIGYDVKVSDNDGDGRDQFAWHMESDDAWQWTSVFGNLQLTKNGMVAIYAGLAAPANLVGEASGADVTLSWDAVTGAVGYNVYSGEDLIAEGITETTYTDAGLDDGTHSYSVVALDEYGIEGAAATVDVVTGVALNIARLTQVYPNPATGNLYVRSTELIESVKLITITGQVVDQIQVNDTFRSIDLTQLKSGLYVVSVQLRESVENYRVMVK